MKMNLIRGAFGLFLLIFLTSSAYPQWIQTDWAETNSFFDLYTNQDTVFARIWDSNNGGRMFYAYGEGDTWSQISDADDDIDMLSLVMWDNNVLGGTWGGFYQCTLNDTTWEYFEPNGIMHTSPIWSIELVGDNLYANTGRNIYKSSIDNYQFWSEVGFSMPRSARVTSVLVDGDTVIVGTVNDGVFISIDGVEDWAAINSGLTDLRISQLEMINNKLFAITMNDGVFVSYNNGSSWQADSSGLENINCLLSANGLLFAGTEDDGVYISQDAGLNWISIGTGMPQNTRIWSLADSGDIIFAATSNGIFRLDPADIQTFVVSASALEGGAISPAGDISIYENGAYTFIITPELGYIINDVLVDDVSVGALDSYTFKNVVGDHTISASFTSVPIYTITASADEGGTISPSGEVLVSETWSREFEITAFPGFTISDVIVDGNSVGVISSYEFTDITEDHIISVVFETAPFMITATAGEGGTISPSGEVDVWGGTSQEFTFTPSQDYEIADVIVDGESVGAVSSYTFDSVSSDHTIEVYFNSFIRYQVNCGAGPVAPFSTDDFYNGGTTYSTSNYVDTNGVKNPAPREVYQTERYGTMSYTFSNLIGAEPYKVRLHFAEIYQTSAGSRLFNVAINGIEVLSNYDIFEQAGGAYLVVIEEFETTADLYGQIQIDFMTITDNAKISAIEIIEQ